MARKVVWSNEATNDLEDLARYIARDSAFYAAAFVEEILIASKTLNKFVERGRIVPEFSDSNIREIFIKGYRLIYHIEITRIVILGIIHSRRDLKKLWQK